MKARIGLAATLLTIATAQVSAQSALSLEQDRKILREACQTLKSPEKRSLCQEAINRLSQAKTSPSLVSEKITTQTRELITLKGVAFDTPGSSDAVMSLCLTPSSLYSVDELKKDTTWCKFNKSGLISMPGFSFGNLSEGLSYATVTDDGSLVYFRKRGAKGEMLELASLLSEKYGKPTVTDTQIENKLGTKFDQKIFVWVDQRGTRITLHSIYQEIDRGQLVIESASLVRAGEVVQKVRNEVGKGNL